MNNFTFENSTRVHFGTDALSHIVDEVADAKTIMIAFGGSSVKRTGTYDRIVEPLRASGKDIVDFGGIMSNPTWDKVLEGAALAREKGVDYIVAAGGGSVMDCSKMVALVARESGSPDELWDKYFVRFEPVTIPTIPLGIVVTATGTGSEGNGGAVITNERLKVKTGADRPALNARFAILDPQLTYTVPVAQKASGGYDTLNHMMEEYFSMPVGDVITDDLLEAGMRSVIRNLPKALDDPEDYQAHANLEWAAHLAEDRVLKCGKATCFQCHALEHQIGAFTDCVHGLGLAAITTNYYRAIYDASPESIAQFKRFAKNVWGIDDTGKSDVEVAAAGIDALQAWTEQVGVARTLSELGCTKELLPQIADKVPGLASSFKQLSRDDILGILEASF
jgi:alcohol dehydrogenase YqhD (iron-dependent ADH family)